MQNTEKEEQSWLKLVTLLVFISMLTFLTIKGEEGDINMDLDNPQTIFVLKLLQGFSTLTIFALPAFLFAAFWTKRKMAYLGLFSKPQIITLFIAIIAMLLALPLINWLAEFNQGMQLPVEFSGIERWMQESEAKAELLTDAFTKGSSVGVLIINIVIIAMLAAFAEEIFFRGILQQVLGECFKNPHIAIWASAFVFSAFHMQFYGFLPRVLMGAYLGYLFYWSGSLWVSIAAHFANNGMAVYAIWLANRGVITADIDKVGAEQGQWIGVVISLAMVVVGLLLIYQKERHSNSNMEP